MFLDHDCEFVIVPRRSFTARRPGGLWISELGLRNDLPMCHSQAKSADVVLWEARPGALDLSLDASKQAILGKPILGPG